MGLAAIVGIAIPEHVGTLIKKLMKIQATAEKTTMLVIGIVRIIFGVFIPFVLFAELGLIAGYSFHAISKKIVGKEENKEPENPNEEEHI